ncbi:hypothetical protein J2X90_000043 [Variovorax paradoxus]|nr:hypothetical protein [Variovorax paradoxus]
MSKFNSRTLFFIEDGSFDCTGNGSRTDLQM